MRIDWKGLPWGGPFCFVPGGGAIVVSLGAAAVAAGLTSGGQEARPVGVKAAVQVNSALLEFYWGLGQDIDALQKKYGWGSGLLNQLSLDLRAAFPGTGGFSLINLKYIKKWYTFYNEEIKKVYQAGKLLPAPFVYQAGKPLAMPSAFAFVPWKHHVAIVYGSKTLQEALFYVQNTINGNWSRAQLENEIKSNLYQRQGNATTNFNTLLPAPQNHLAQELLKDPYNFEFLTMKKGYNEKDLENALLQNITRLLLELGQGFAYVGRQMELTMPNGKSYYPDLVFYHLPQKRYLVVELKVVDFDPEYAGKLNFYVNAANELLRGEDDNETIGLLICKSKDQTTVEWTLRGMTTPIGVAEYLIKEVVDQTIQEAKKLPKPKEEPDSSNNKNGPEEPSN